jgi:hypothetical protein
MHGTLFDITNITLKMELGMKSITLIPIAIGTYTRWTFSSSFASIEKEKWLLEISISIP